MTNDATKCPNCRKRAVSEFDNCFQCMECGNWGYARDRLPYGHEQSENFRPNGQVYRKPKAA